MLLQKEDSGSKVNIKSYEPGEITLNIGQFSQAIFLLNGDKKDFSGAKSFQELNFEDIKPALVEKPEILIIGTGHNHQILPISLTKQINALGIAVEAMASRQACHTYQVLMYEQRVVYALIYP